MSIFTFLAWRRGETREGYVCRSKAAATLNNIHRLACDRSRDVHVTT